MWTMVALRDVVTCTLSLLLCYSQFTATAADGLKLKNRAARFANTLGTTDSPKVRMEPLTLTRPNVGFA